jgi:CheY-like chemotaxis protein
MARVLVVDDDAASRAMTAAMLDQHHHVYSAKNGREAFAVLRATPHRLIVLLGGTMPTMTGWEALEAIMREVALARRHIYIVWSADRRLLAWARDQHAIPHRSELGKPFSAEQLLEAVDWATRQLEMTA